MKTKALFLTAALLASGATYAFAQQGPGTPPSAGQTQPPSDARQQTRGGREVSQETFNRLVDSRIAAIKAGLKLNAEQERLWPPVEQAIRASANERFENRRQMRGAREQRQAMDLMQRLEARASMMTQNAQRASTLATALRPLWNTFSDEQKEIAPRLMRMSMGGMGGRMDERRGWRERGEQGSPPRQ